MAPLLVGTAATGTAAATTGLFGTAGAFALAPTLATVGTGMMAYGKLQAGRAAEAEARNAQIMMDYNARVAEQQAEAERQKAHFDQLRHAKHAERVKSLMSARMGAAGAAGSPVALDVKMKQAEELELENLLIGYEGETAAMRAESQAELDRLQGRIYRERGRNLRRASYYGAGSRILTGFGGAFT